jgi:hypothetical protein
MWHPKWRTQHLKNNIGSNDAQLHQGKSAKITETITVREKNKQTKGQRNCSDSDNQAGATQISI